MVAKLERAIGGNAAVAGVGAESLFVDCAVRFSWLLGLSGRDITGAEQA